MINTDTIATMKDIEMKKRGLGIVFLLCAAFGMAQVPAPPQKKSILITEVTVHIGNGKEIQDGAVGFRDGKIDYVGSTALAPKGYQVVIQETGKHLYPGFIAVNSTLGLNEISAVRATRDMDETGEYNPHVRSLIAYNTDSRVTPTVRANGILMAQVSPQGGRVSGTSSVMMLDGWNWEDAVLKEDDGIHVNWPETTKWSWETRERAADPDYEKKVADLRAFFERARSYANESKPAYDIRADACKDLFNGKKRLYVHTDRAVEMTSAIHMAQDLGIDNLVIVGGYDAHLITPLLKDRKVSVMIGRIHGLPTYPEDDVHQNYKLAGILEKAGILFCLENSDRMPEMNTMNLPFNAGTCVAYVLDKRAAISAITLNPAKILGIDKRCGSIEMDKDATLFISSGDALDMRTNNVVRAFIQGRDIDLDNFQKQLNAKYKQKYQG
jgi:imidazolonepropionase-like amidohydrolase